MVALVRRAARKVAMGPSRSQRQSARAMAAAPVEYFSPVASRTVSPGERRTP